MKETVGKSGEYMTYYVALVCVVAIATGQILFKLSAISMRRADSFFDPTAIAVLCSALAIYGASTVAWVWVLQQNELSRMYPLMALSFILVPIGSHFILYERFPRALISP